MGVHFLLSAGNMYLASLVSFIAPLCMGQNVVLHSQPLPVAPPPPQPYNYAYSAARVPGASPDRYASQQGDELGVVRGQYAYLDPNYKWQQGADGVNGGVVIPVVGPQD